MPDDPQVYAVLMFEVHYGDGGKLEEQRNPDLVGVYATLTAAQRAAEEDARFHYGLELEWSPWNQAVLWRVGHVKYAGVRYRYQVQATYLRN